MAVAGQIYLILLQRAELIFRHEGFEFMIQNTLRNLDLYIRMNALNIQEFTEVVINAMDFQWFCLWLPSW
jgi:hypothetical protein